MSDPMTEERLAKLAYDAGMHDEDFLRHPAKGSHPMCEWCQYAHINGARLISEIRRLRLEVGACE